MYLLLNNLFWPTQHGLAMEHGCPCDWLVTCISILHNGTIKLLFSDHAFSNFSKIVLGDLSRENFIFYDECLCQLGVYEYWVELTRLLRFKDNWWIVDYSLDFFSLMHFAPCTLWFVCVFFSFKSCFHGTIMH